MHELKRLHVQENRQLQVMAAKTAAIEDEQFRKMELDKQVCTLTIVSKSGLNDIFLGLDLLKVIEAIFE